jgi:hypothetical protein
MKYLEYKDYIEFMIKGVERFEFLGQFYLVGLVAITYWLIATANQNIELLLAIAIVVGVTLFTFFLFNGFSRTLRANEAVMNDFQRYREKGGETADDEGRFVRDINRVLEGEHRKIRRNRRILSIGQLIIYIFVIGLVVRRSSEFMSLFP